jgi:hypothetical protein
VGDVGVAGDGCLGHGGREFGGCGGEPAADLLVVAGVAVVSGDGVEQDAAPVAAGVAELGFAEPCGEPPEQLPGLGAVEEDEAGSPASSTVRCKVPGGAGKA